MTRVQFCATNYTFEWLHTTMMNGEINQELDRPFWIVRLTTLPAVLNIEYFTSIADLTFYNIQNRTCVAILKLQFDEPLVRCYR
jgi:hypothetical protein